MARLISCCCLTLAALASVADAQPDDGPAALQDLSIRSMPLKGDTYGFDETIALEVRFDRPVKPTGPLLLPLQIGAETKNAAYKSCMARPADPAGSCRLLWFHYRIEPSDSDVDGISVATDPLLIGSGTILDLNGNPVALDLGDRAIVNDPRHKVHGGVTNSQSGLSALQTPLMPSSSTGPDRPG